MVNIRFHIVSLIAVFLALLIGVAVGAGVVNGVLVSNLNSQLDRLDADRTARGAKIRQLEAQLVANQDLTDLSQDRLLAGHLLGVPVVLVAVRGIDEQTVQNLSGRLRAAGGTGVSVLWLTNRFALADTAEQARARAALGAASDRPETLRYLLRERVRAALMDAGDASVSQDLQPLRQAGLLDWASPPTGGLGTRVVFVTAPNAPLSDDDLLGFVRDLAGPTSRGRVLLVGVSDDEGAPTVIGSVRSDATLATQVPTVDDLDDASGPLAAVLALEDLGRGRVGHYGRLLRPRLLRPRLL
jgi:hypothetical protein